MEIVLETWICIIMRRICYISELKQESRSIMGSSYEISGSYLDLYIINDYLDQHKTSFKTRGDSHESENHQSKQLLSNLDIIYGVYNHPCYFFMLESPERNRILLCRLRSSDRKVSTPDNLVLQHCCYGSKQRV